MTTVITYNEIEGFHCWPQAPNPVEYLRHLHRHIFFIECEFEVSSDDREIEIIMQQEKIREFLKNSFGKPLNLGSCSCETLAGIVLQQYPKCRSCTVREDGMGGARVTR